MSDALTAYHSRVTMHEAKWTDQEGSTVTFKLPMSRDAEEQRNPFHAYTKRRKGKAGTRFMMACVNEQNSLQSVYEDEVMLAGWNDSQTNGHTVKFWLCSDALGHPFDGFNRNKDVFYISLVELDDDNEPINQKMRDRVESVGKRPSERLSYVAAMLCKNEGFWQYVREVSSDQWKMDYKHLDDENLAREFMLCEMSISSRAELDKDPVLAERFHDVIRRPFLEWRGEY
jgi:hypothetical protein